jgi:hypothetical protein
MPLQELTEQHLLAIEKLVEKNGKSQFGKQAYLLLHAQMEQTKGILKGIHTPSQHIKQLESIAEQQSKDEKEMDELEQSIISANKLQAAHEALAIKQAKVAASAAGAKPIGGGKHNTRDPWPWRR